MKIAVGSTNPTKINATKLAFRKMFPGKQIMVIGISVSSGIPDQPMSATEALTGAKNRARRALKKTRADFGIGLEGGMQKIHKYWIETGWCAIVDTKGNLGIGSSIHMQVPPKLLRHIKKGKELGQATDIEFATIESGKKTGFFGLMTNGKISRTKGYADGIIAALTRFLHPQLF